MAADGRGISKDTEQKLFPVTKYPFLAYCISGTPRLSLDDGTGIFDIPSLMADIFESHSISTAEVFADIPAAISKQLARIVTTARRTYLHSDTMPDTYVCIFGYFNDTASSGIVTLAHASDVTHPLHQVEDLRYQLAFSGSTKIRDLLKAGDERFREYLTPLRRDVASLESATKYVHNQVRAQCDPISLEIDPDNCEWIGGRIHVATVSRTAGFSWAPGFEPS